LLLRATSLPTSKFYRDLKFAGEFDVPVGTSSFKINNEYTTIENDIFWNGVDTYETETIWLWKLLSKDALVVFEVGANSGFNSLITKRINPTINTLGVCTVTPN